LGIFSVHIATFFGYLTKGHKTDPFELQNGKRYPYRSENGAGAVSLKMRQWYAHCGTSRGDKQQQQQHQLH